ncbi:MAG TPA: hypothetical protein VIQ81_02945 [Gammaproteobacteria bacterium]
MKNIPVTISLILLLVIGVTALWLPNSKTVNLTAYELVQAEIALLATLGALVSATFVVYSYLQTNMAFLESKRPQLLVQVESQNLQKSQEDPEIIPLSLIHYRNVTHNQFNDLNINITVESANRTVDISDLFKNNMVMIGHDSRIRRFKPIELLCERGMDINRLTAAGNEVLMKIQYEYSFLNNNEVVSCQEYKWDPTISQWIIP